MHGVLKPTPSSRDAYSQVTSLDGNGYYGGAQFHHQPQQQTPQQQSQSQPNSWAGAVDTPYSSSTGAYGSPSAQYSTRYAGAYATPVQPSSAYQNYDPSSNTYTYPHQPEPTSSQQQAAAAQTPDSAQRQERNTYGLHARASVDDLDEFVAQLQADMDAAVVNGENELCKSELSLGPTAFIPLMRPNIGPYADGGNQDLPVEFKANFPSDTATDNQPGQGEAQPQSQDSPEQDDEASQGPSQTQQDEDPSEPAQPASASQSQETPPQPPPAPPPDDPLKRCPNATVSSILSVSDPEIRAIVQRAASRGLVQRIMNLDGFKYMFNNFWTSRVDNDGLRFSYICRDSLQNKDRHAHVPARASTVPPVHRQMFRKTKESWDCKGSISVKFSQAVDAIVVQYRHAAVHPTHAARKRPPRKPAQKSGRGVGRPRGSTGGMKRKRDSDVEYGGPGYSLPASSPAYFHVNTQKEPSLFQLLQQSAEESVANGEPGQLGDASRPWWANS